MTQANAGMSNIFKRMIRQADQQFADARNGAGDIEGSLEVSQALRHAMQTWKERDFGGLDRRGLEMVCQSREGQHRENETLFADCDLRECIWLERIARAVLEQLEREAALEAAR